MSAPRIPRVYFVNARDDFDLSFSFYLLKEKHQTNAQGSYFSPLSSFANDRNLN